MDPIKVRLKTDLTHYVPGLVVGTEGVAIGQYGMWSRGSDRFIGVDFPGKGKLDVLWESLEIIDEEYLRRSAEAEQKWRESLKSAQHVVKYVGPQGGFRRLSFEYTDSNGSKVHHSTGFKSEGDKLEKLFNDLGIAVEIQREGKETRGLT